MLQLPVSMLHDKRQVLHMFSYKHSENRTFHLTFTHGSNVMLVKNPYIVEGEMEYSFVLICTRFVGGIPNEKYQPHELDC